MEEEILKEMASTLNDIKERLSVGHLGGLRGPVADPGPEWVGHPRGPVADPSLGWIGHLRGPIADPAPWYLLDKAKLAQLKIRRIDAAITELEKQIDFLKLEQDLLREEYKIK